MRNEVTKETTEEESKVKKVPGAKEVQPNMSQKPTDTLAVEAVPNATDTQPSDPPKSLPGLVSECVDVTDCSGEEVDEEMPLLEDADP